MALLACVVEVLKREPYSALELSAGAHIPVRCSAKVVIASEDDIYSADTEWL